MQAHGATWKEPLLASHAGAKLKKILEPQQEAEGKQEGKS
jgi:hypothetical protein